MAIRQAPWWAGVRVRYRLTAAPGVPLRIELPDKEVTVTYADLVRHAGGREVAAVSCVSSTLTIVNTGGAQFPEVRRLYTGSPLLITLWPGDSLRFFAAKPGGVTLGLLLPVFVET
jgi:hypothetical protein